MPIDHSFSNCTSNSKILLTGARQVLGTPLLRATAPLWVNFPPDSLTMAEVAEVQAGAELEVECR